MPPPRAESVPVVGPAGSLETLLELPAGPVVGVAVICHPHPLHGGAMSNKVVHTLARAALQLGCAAWRFNFRGVGASAGQFDHGVGETDDALALQGAAAVRWPGLPLLLAGFSFGGAVALRAAARQPPALLVTVAPALDRVPAEVLVAPPCPWLIVHGDRDEVVPLAGSERWVAERAPQAHLVRLPGVGHFFHGALPVLQAAVVDFVDSERKKKPGAFAPGH